MVDSQDADFLQDAEIMQLADQHPKHCLEVLKLPHSIDLMFIFYLDELMIEINIIVENNKRSLTVFMKISSSSLSNQRNWTFPKHLFSRINFNFKMVVLNYIFFIKLCFHGEFKKYCYDCRLLSFYWLKMPIKIFICTKYYNWLSKIFGGNY